MLISNGKTIFVLLERKASISLEDKETILNQLSNTKAAFLTKLKEVDFRKQYDLPNIDDDFEVYSMVYYEVGDHDMATILIENGYYVLNEQMEFRCPTTTPP